MSYIRRMIIMKNYKVARREKLLVNLIMTHFVHVSKLLIVVSLIVLLPYVNTYGQDEQKSEIGRASCRERV